MNNELKAMLQSVIQEALEPVIERLDRLEDGMGNMRTRIDSIEVSVSEMKDKVDNLGLELKVVNRKLDTISKQVAENTEKINEQFNTQKKHERTLAILSLRSIQHEGDLQALYELKHAE